jgi:hypothetical protein
MTLGGIGPKSLCRILTVAWITSATRLAKRNQLQSTQACVVAPLAQVVRFRVSQQTKWRSA